MSKDRCIEELGEFIEKSVSPFHTVDTVKKYLDSEGFDELNMSGKINIVPGGKYYFSIYDSSLMAFKIGEKWEQGNSKMRLRMSASHTDFPCFKIKPNYLMTEKTDEYSGYVKVNTETYGGAILNTWLDRPLSIAGKVVVRGKGWLENEEFLVDIDRPVLIIPNLAIHMNREVNKGVELNKQKDMLPIIGLMDEENDYRQCIEKLIADEITSQGRKTSVDDIVDYELYVYQFEKGCKVGINEEMYSSPRLDNLTSAFAQIKALSKSERENGIDVALFYDNEEIGSTTKQGAASSIVMLLMEKIYSALGFDRNIMIDDILGGMMLSIDVSHASHPNSPEKSDKTNKVMLNKGLAIKLAAGQSYANDALSTSMVKTLCNESDVKWQIFVNRSDMTGGKTLGSLGSTVVPMRTIDVGIPVLAMHSARELMGCEDQKNLEKFLTGYYS